MVSETAEHKRNCHLLLADYRLTRAPGHLIRRAQQRAVDLYMDEVGEDGLTPRQFAVLVNVYQNDGINQTDLVRLSGIDRSTLTEILRRLAARNLILRRRMERDQRTNILSITPAGIQALEDAFDAMARAQDRIMEPVPPTKRAAALELLALLAGRPEKD
jgi:DNA-binding MarR family transcriptional regulator